MNRVEQRVEEWKRKIVDLSRRNRSLYFARTRGSTLKITEPDLSEIFENLVNSEEPWEFCMPPDAPKAPEQSESDKTEESTRENRAGEGSEDRDVEIPVDRHADELLTDIEDGAKRRSIL